MEMGLDSLATTQLVRGLSEGLDVQVSPTVLFNYPTIDALSEHLAGLLVADDGNEVVSIPRIRSVTPPPARRRPPAAAAAECSLRSQIKRTSTAVPATAILISTCTIEYFETSSRVLRLAVRRQC